MANKQPSPKQSPVSSPVDGGGVDSQSVDGFGWDSNRPGDPPPVQTDSPNRREASGDRDPAPEGSGPENDIRVPVPATLPGEGPRGELYAVLKSIAQDSNSPNVFQVIGQRFVDARKLQKAEAWRQLQEDLMLAAPFLCPGLMSFKDLLGAAREIEDFVKGATGKAGRSNEELMQEFLNGGGPLAVNLPLPPPEGIDTDAILIEGDEGGTPTEAHPASDNLPPNPSPSPI